MNGTRLDYEAALDRIAELEAKLRKPITERQLAFALKGLYYDQVDYLTLNKLGGMDNHWMRAARIALADYARETEGDAK